MAKKPTAVQVAKFFAAAVTEKLAAEHIEAVVFRKGNSVVVKSEDTRCTECVLNLRPYPWDWAFYANELTVIAKQAPFLRETRYVVTTATYEPWRNTFAYLGSAVSRYAADAIALRERHAGGRALIHDRKTGTIVRDTGKPYGQVWAEGTKRGQKSPKTVWENC